MLRRGFWHTGLYKRTTRQLATSRKRAFVDSILEVYRFLPFDRGRPSQRLHATLPVALTERISPNPRLRILTKNIIHSASKSGREPICRDRIIPSKAKKRPLKFLIILVALLAAGGGYYFWRQAGGLPVGFASGARRASGSLTTRIGTNRRPRSKARLIATPSF